MIRVRAYKEHWISDHVTIVPMEVRDTTRCRLASFTWEEVKEGDAFSSQLREDSFKIDSAAAQRLMDDLWTCGIRPTDGTGSAGQSAAQQLHIKDLEDIVGRYCKASVR